MGSIILGLVFLPLMIIIALLLRNDGGAVIYRHRREAVRAASERIARSLSSGHKLLLCGNGGSAGDGQVEEALGLA